MLIKVFIIICLWIHFAPIIGQQRWCAVNSIVNESTNSLIENHPSSISSRSEKWFQVVVHDVSKSETPISYAQVVHQIDVLNNDFAKKGANIHKLREEFTDLAADTEILFCLATEDPEGNPTTGLTYTNTNIDRIALANEMGRSVVHYDQLGGKTGWDPSRYINIWVADYGTSGILGYGSLPGTAPYPEEIGLVIDRNYFGSIGTATHNNFFNRGHTLTHEMGHFFGLLHIWGDDDMSCSDSDGVVDTPNATGPYIGCPSGRQESCGTSNMYQNFMDLTDDRCLAAFTHGQAMRMQATVDLFYPDLASGSSCPNAIQLFQQWWEELIWAYDSGSGQYVFYHPEGHARNLEINVFTVDGKAILSNQFDSQRSYLINLHGRHPGIYFVEINDGEERFVRKIVIY